MSEFPDNLDHVTDALGLLGLAQHAVDRITGIPSSFMEQAQGVARTATEVQHAAQQAHANAYNNGLQNLAGTAVVDNNFQGIGSALAQAPGFFGGLQHGNPPPFGQLGQLSHGQPLGGLGGLGGSLSDYADPVKNRAMQHERGLAGMNALAREKYEPIFQLMGISLTAPWILSMSIVSHPSEWKMEIDVDGKTYRHVWDMLKDDPAEWDAEVGYFLDKVARLRQSLLPPQDAGEPEPVLGSVSGPSRGSVAGGSGRDGGASGDPAAQT